MAVKEESTTVTIEGNILKALKSFCDRTDCKTVTEGVRALVKTLPDYKKLSPDDSGNPIKAETESQA